MTITLNWIPDTNIIHFVSMGKWTWQDFYDAMDELYVMIDASDHEHVDYILDITRGDLFPQNALSQFSKISMHTHQKTRYMVFVGAGGFARVLMKMMRRLLPNRMAYVLQADTLEDARTHLREKTISSAVMI
jgi:hypothetical protein